VVDIKPSEPEGYLFLAKAVALSGDILLSIDELKRGLKNVPQNSALRMELIRYYQREQEWEYALETADAGLVQRPQELAYEIQKGRILARLKKLDKAEKVFASIIERHPTITAGYLELGRLKEAAGDYRKATGLFGKALDLKKITLWPSPSSVPFISNKKDARKQKGTSKRPWQHRPAGSGRHTA
jgi:tetratricopeptide (TPR) repeat protein